MVGSVPGCQNFNSLTGTFTKLSSKPGDKEAQTSCKEIKENVFPAWARYTTDGLLDQIKDFCCLDCYDLGTSSGIKTSVFL